MRDDIINILKNSTKAIDIYEISDLLGIKSVEDTTKLSEELKKLEDEVIVYRSNKNKYMMLEDSHLKKGIMRVNKKGFGFVEVGGLEDDIFISSDNMNGAIHDDVVLVEITSKMNLSRLEGRVLRIIERKITRYIGLIKFDKKGIGHITLDDNKIKLDIEIPSDKAKNAVDGHKVVVELGKKLGDNKYQGEVVEIIGHINDPGVDILSIIYKYNIDIDFSEETKKQLESIPMKVRESD